jgi:hypothetical protein
LRVQFVNNLWIAFRFMEKENVGVRYVGPEDIAVGRLGFVVCVCVCVCVCVQVWLSCLSAC